MKTLNPGEATLRDQFRQKLVDSSRNVFSEADLLQLAIELRLEQGFPRSLSERNFVRRIIQDVILKAIPLSATYSFEAKRYHYGAFTGYELASSLKPGGYLCHGTAAQLHHLIDHEPTIIYVNKEQSPKTAKGSLSQTGIDRAFSHKQRQSGNIVTHDRTQIVLLSGKSSNRLGVVKIAGPQSEPLELTNVDRTLIDIAVRPTYAGSAKSVAKAYRNAFSQTSVSRLAKMRWSDVDMEKNVLNILAQKTGKMRTIPLNSSGLKVLGAWSLNRKNDLVFYNHGTSEKFVDLKADSSLACKKAGISDVSWHTLRHTFASRLLDRGVDIGQSP